MFVDEIGAYDLIRSCSHSHSFFSIFFRASFLSVSREFFACPVCLSVLGCFSSYLGSSLEVCDGSGVAHSTVPRGGSAPFQSSVLFAVPYSSVLATLSMPALDSSDTHRLLTTDNDLISV